MYSYRKAGLVLLLVLAGLLSSGSLFAQYVYTIKADSVLLTGCDSNELIIENHTQAVPGFLYNTGKGRTAFRRALIKLNDTLYLVGPDTLKVPNAWVQGGNAWHTTGKFGTLDSNHIDFYTNDTVRGRWTAKGNLIVGSTTDNGNAFQVNGIGTVSRQLRVGYFASAPALTPEVSGQTIITEGTVSAKGGFNLRDPGTADGIMTGMFTSSYNGALQLYQVNYPCLALFTVGGSSLGGSVVTINNNFNPTSGSATVNVLDFSSANISMITGSNTLTYNYENLSPIISQQTYGTGITRGLYINPNLASAHDWRSIETVVGDNRFNTTSGNTGIGLNAAPTSKLDVSGTNGYSQFRLRTSYTPTSTSDANGNTGDFSWDGNYFYVKTPAGWKRSALTTF